MSKTNLTTLSSALVLASFLALPAAAVEDQSIPDDSMGLSKTSVYDVPNPAVYKYGGGDPGTNKRNDRSYMTAPPMITHNIDGMVPIKRGANVCKDCHVQPALIGQKIEPGMPIPAPASHYANVKKGQLYMGRWTCTQCHRPQAKVDVLVQNTFTKAK